MKQLGLDRYVAGLHKDEMAASYKISKPEPDTVLQDLCDVSDQLLRETFQWCQLGPEQRMTDPQAVRISSFWLGADPEGKASSFPRNAKVKTLNEYLLHWRPIIAFCWRGWQGVLSKESLKTLREQAARTGYGGLEHNEEAPGGSSSYESNSDMDSSSDCSVQTSHGTVARRYFNLTSRQKKCLQDCVAAAAVEHDDDDDSVNAAGGSGLDGIAESDDREGREQRLALLKAPAVAFARSMIQQHLKGSLFESPLVAYAAMHSVNRFGHWEEPGSYNSNLSALVYCGQLWIFRFACEQVDRRSASLVVERGRAAADGDDIDEGDDGLDGELDLQMRRYFTNTVSKPLAHILLWRRRLFNIAPITMVNRPASWNLDHTTVTYRGQSISMDEVRTVLRKTIDRARHTLFSKLMFDVEHLPRLTPNDLQENDSERAPGWWFGRHRQNMTILHGHEEASAEHVASTAHLRSLWMEDARRPASNVPGLAWRTEGISLYRELVQEFLKDLAAAVHFSAGPPVRAPEFISPMWQNTERLRHIQLRYGKVVFHLVEHKMMATSGKNVNNIRFLCNELSELLVNYLVYVVPLLESMAWQDKSNTSVTSPFLWADADGKPWPETRFGDMLKAACRRAEVSEVGTAVWRQMSSAIINTHFDDVVDRTCLLTVAQGAEASAAEIDEDGRDSLAASLVSMSNHSLRTHRMSYANDSPFANVWDGMLAKSYRASLAWAQFFGLDRTDDQECVGTSNGASTTAATAVVAKTLGSSQFHNGRKRSISNVSGSDNVDTMRKLQNIGSSRTKRHWSGAALLAEAQRMYRNDELKWRCPEQEQALRLVANSKPEVLLILATGSGKSLTFMLGCSLPSARTTIVIVPLVLLRLDLVRRCRQMGIEPTLWKNARDVAVGMDSSPALLFVSVEVATGPGFRQYARRLYDTGNLDRIVFDECHLIQTSAHYRRSMAKLVVLRELAVPFVYMTATLPPRLEAVLCRRHCIGRPIVVRGCSKRPNIQYGVQHLRPPPGEGFLAYACNYIRTRWDAAPVSDWKDPRVMVFVRSCEEAERAAEFLGCEYYHREIGSVEEKEKRLARWISGDSVSPFLACTTAAGPGVDYPHVRWVVHIEDPYGLGDYAQESGRAGRDGEAAGATVLMKRDPKQAAPPTPLDHPDPTDDQALKDYLYGADCRRLCFARDLDTEQHWKSCEDGDIACDVCTEVPWTEDNNSRFIEAGERNLATQDARANGQGADGDTDQVEEQDEAARATMEEGGVIQLRRQQLQEQQEMDEYLLRLSLVQGTCVLCRILSPGACWKHKMDDCKRQHKWRYFSSKRTVVERKGGVKRWLLEYAACYFCGQPQELCGQWEAGKAGEGPRSKSDGAGGCSRSEGPKGCRYRDLALPAVWALWTCDGFEREWLRGRVAVAVQDEVEVLIAAGRVTEFGGVRCVLGVRVFAELLEKWETGIS